MRSRSKQVKLTYESRYDESDTATEKGLASRVSFLTIIKRES